VEANGAGHNGSGSALASEDRRLQAPPDRVRDLAEACVGFVERAVGVKLDYEPETLPILDHYLAGARAAAGERPAAGALVAHAAGAYFGEVMRRRYASWWRLDGEDPGAWRIELEPVYLSVSPVQLMADALYREGDDPDASERLELEDDDRHAVAARLAELPQVGEDEFYAPSTRLEVIDIAVEAIRAHRLAGGEAGDSALGPDDYEPALS
jgi:hypothetical protein